MAKKRMTNAELEKELARVKELAEKEGIDTSPPPDPTNNLMDKVEREEEKARDQLMQIIKACEEKTGRALTDCARPRFFPRQSVSMLDSRQLKMMIGLSMTRMGRDLKAIGMDQEEICEMFVQRMQKGYEGNSYRRSPFFRRP